MNDTPATPEPQALMRSILQRIATGPELSKDIAFDEARRGFYAVIQNQVDPIQAGIFLIALRMKRETEDEMKGILSGILDASVRATADVDEVLDIADPYDGYNRTLPAAPFLPALMAELGVPSVSHGVESMGPKFGTTHRQVLRAAGQPVDLTPDQAAQRVSDPAVGWAYVDQSRYCPGLAALAAFRTTIVKRTAVTTAEVLIGPVRGRSKTRFVTGYVHKPYPPMYAMLARHSGFDSALLVRGVEGGVIPSLRQPGKAFYYHDQGPEQAMEMNPSDLGIAQEVRAAPIPEGIPHAGMQADDIAVAVDTEAVAVAAAMAGREALGGAPGPVRDSLVYAGALMLHHVRRADSLAAAAARVREVLDAGSALRRLEG